MCRSLGLKGAKDSACQCPGNCLCGHRAGQPCIMTPICEGALALCINCCCCLVGCGQPKFRTRYCFSHAYMNLSIEFRVIRLASADGFLERMVPEDVKAFLAHGPVFCRDEALLFVAAWIMEPAAIRFLETCCPAQQFYTGEELSTSIQQVRPT